ncbi:MAG TPA: DUF4349 domain-containing protein [Candidatus Saccharimonadales bacterium]|jgi:hypothetical protein|nr:DUF4349 domain-containing protein [Candidatus Saccharimonadales bacterium]
MNTSNHPVGPEELMAYLDGELSQPRAAETAAHLEHCPECQTLAAELREVSHQLMDWQVETPEGANPADLFTVLEKEEKRPAIAARKGILEWWKVIQLSRMVWAGSMVAVMALASVFFVSRAHRPGFAEKNVMQGYANPPVNSAQPGQTNFDYSNGVLPPPAPPPANRNEAAGAADKTKRSNAYGFKGSVSAPASGAENATAQTSAALIVTAAAGNTVNAKSADAEGSSSTNGMRQQNGVLDDAEAKDEREAGPRPAAKKAQSPMIVHEAQLSLVSRDFDHGRAAIEEILKRHGGYVGSLNVAAPAGSGRTLNATLRVPAIHLQETMAELKKLGRVTAEAQTGEEVTEQYVDLEARLSNARNSEQRLKELLRERTGKLKDVMEVELQIDRVRGEIETMDAERKNLGSRVDFATLTVTLAEEYKAELQVVPVSTWNRMGNAAVEGYRTMIEGVVSVVLGLLSVLPSLLLWAVLLLFPARWTWKKLKSLKLQRAAV